MPRLPQGTQEPQALDPLSQPRRLRPRHCRVGGGWRAAEAAPRRYGTLAPAAGRREFQPVFVPGQLLTAVSFPRSLSGEGVASEASKATSTLPARLAGSI
ncbi:unnamed protein product [Caretta caretta]